jgi:hypothetical protein
MGFNILLARWPAGDHEDPSEDDRFDALRRRGDWEFFSWLMDHGESRTSVAFEHVYRPRSFVAAEIWIHQHVRYAGNRDRLLSLMGLLRREPDLWLEGSW